MRFILRRPCRVLTVMLLWAGYWPDGLCAQEEYRNGDYIVRRAPCWETVLAFYDHRAFPYYSVDGYFFDANPFQITRWMDGNMGMIMRSTRGTWLIDMSGRYRWTDARIKVDCYVREYLWGLITQPYAVVAYELGTVSRFPPRAIQTPVIPGVNTLRRSARLSMTPMLLTKSLLPIVRVVGTAAQEAFPVA